MLLTILSIIVAFVVGFVVGRAQALSILDEVEKLLNRQIQNYPILVVSKKNGEGDAPAVDEDKGDPWTGN